MDIANAQADIFMEQQLEWKHAAAKGAAGGASASAAGACAEGTKVPNER